MSLEDRFIQKHEARYDDIELGRTSIEWIRQDNDSKYRYLGGWLRKVRRTVQNIPEAAEQIDASLRSLEEIRSDNDKLLLEFEATMKPGDRIYRYQMRSAEEVVFGIAIVSEDGEIREKYFETTGSLKQPPIDVNAQDLSVK